MPNDTGIEVMPVNIWERMPGETDAAFMAFTKYCEYPVRPRPSPVEWARQVELYAPNSVMMWSAPSGYNWRERVYEYDLYEAGLDKDSEKRKRGRQVEIQEDEARDYVEMRTTWDAALRKVQEQIAMGEIEDGIENLNRLALARQRIDSIGRKAASMPATYRHVPEKKDDGLHTRENLFLDWNDGPTLLQDGSDDNITRTT